MTIIIVCMLKTVLKKKIMIITETACVQEAISRKMTIIKIKIASI